MHIKMDSDEVSGLIASILAAICFGSYGVPMKGEAATRVDVDPLVFLSYNAVTMFFTYATIIWARNILADSCSDSSFETCYLKWTFYDFTPWAFASAFLWVPGGTAGVYAIRHAGLAVSTGIWCCVIVILSFVWGVFIFGEKQKSTFGAIMSVTLLCVGLCGVSYFSSIEVEMKKNGPAQEQPEMINVQQGDSLAGETAPLLGKGDNKKASLDLQHFPHSGMPPHCHETIDLDPSVLPATPNGRACHLSKYHLGLYMAVVNGVLASTIMVPLHYAPPKSTHGIGYSMSLGIAAVLMVPLFWMLRYMCLSLEKFIGHSSWRNVECRGLNITWQLLQQIATDSLSKGYQQLPSLHIRVMWKAGLTSGVLYSLANFFAIISIQKLGNFMGYSLNQSSVIVSGLWGLFYYREIPGSMNIIGFLASLCVMFFGIMLMAREHQV